MTHKRTLSVGDITELSAANFSRDLQNASPFVISLLLCVKTNQNQCQPAQSRYLTDTAVLLDL